MSNGRDIQVLYTFKNPEGYYELQRVTVDDKSHLELYFDGNAPGGDIVPELGERETVLANELVSLQEWRMKILAILDNFTQALETIRTLKGEQNTPR